MSKAWYESLSRFLLENGFSMEKEILHFLLSIRMKIYSLFKFMLIMKIYLLFKFMLMILYLVLLMSLCVRNLLSCVSKEFEMVMIGELKYFLGLQKTKTNKEPSSIKPNIWEIYLKCSNFKMERLKALQWAQQSSSTKMKKVKKLMSNISRYDSIFTWFDC